MEAGAELGGRGRGTARAGARCGNGRLRSERRRGRAEEEEDAAEEEAVAGGG